MIIIHFYEIFGLGPLILGGVDRQIQLIHQMAEVF